MNLTATVIEVAPQEGYAIIRYQLAGVDSTTTSGDCFSVVTENYANITVGDVHTITL